MNTPTHILLAAALFARPGHPRRSTAAVIGGLLPDASLYVMVAWERFANGLTPDQIFDEAYFSRFWQTVFAVDNSAPIYGLLLAVGVWARQPWVFALAGAALTHIALDLPLHHDDGRAHFFPFTDWVFESPVSYWDVHHYGGVVGPLETGLAVLLAVILWTRWRALWIRASVAFLFVAQLLTSALWLIAFG